MTNPKRALLLGFATLAVAGCQTIREELPTSATSGGSGGSNSANVTPIPVVVVPVPIPVPTSGPDPVPTNPTPTTPSNPNPNPPRPTPGPTNPNNNSGTVRIGAKVYFIERNGQTMPEGSDAQVGDRIHFDATAKDAQNLPTTTRGAPHWTFTNQGIINVTSSPNDWTPVVIARSGGTFQAYVEADGVRSITVSVWIH